MKDFGQKHLTSFPAAILCRPPSLGISPSTGPRPAQLCTHTRHSLPLTLTDGPPDRTRPGPTRHGPARPPRTRTWPHSPSSPSSSLPHAEQPRSARSQVLGPLLAQHCRPKQVRPALVGALTSQHTLSLTPTASAHVLTRTPEGSDPKGSSLIGLSRSPLDHPLTLGLHVTRPHLNSHQVAHWKASPAHPGSIHPTHGPGPLRPTISASGSGHTTH
jgi:hypothetical protein